MIRAIANDDTNTALESEPLVGGLATGGGESEDKGGGTSMLDCGDTGGESVIEGSRSVAEDDGIGSTSMVELAAAGGGPLSGMEEVITEPPLSDDDELKDRTKLG